MQSLRSEVAVCCQNVRFFDPVVNRETMRLLVESLPAAGSTQLTLPSFLKLLESLC